MERRAFLGALALNLFTIPLVVEAQTGKIPRIGYLGGSLASGFHEGFGSVLRQVGYADGQIVVEYRWYGGSLERAKGLVRELIDKNVDVLVTVGPFGAVAAKEATSTIPTVFVLAGNPVRTGLVTSLAHPGGNRTGSAYDPTPELTGKTVQLLKEVVPSASRMGVLWNPQSPDTEPYLREARRSSKVLGLSTVDAPVESVGDFEDAFVLMMKRRAEALIVIPDPVTVVYQRRLTELAAKHKLPAIYQFRQAVEAGGLLSYGPTPTTSSRRWTNGDTNCFRPTAAQRAKSNLGLGVARIPDRRSTNHQRAETPKRTE